MLFQAVITIPKSTLKVAPVRVEMPIDQGVITKFMVRPRPGHSALAHLIILHHEHQIAPSIRDMELHGDTFPIDWEDYLEVPQPPFELVLEGWNDDDTYAHTFDIYIAMILKTQTLGQIVADAIRSLFSLTTIKRIFTGGD